MDREETVDGAALHVVWDWNGTLLDDAAAVIAATIAAFAEAGLPEVTEESYRRHFTRPIRLFYERLIGRSVDPDEWVRLDHAFHDRYHVLCDACSLTAGALESLELVRERGWTQSLCSMLPEQYLVPEVERHGIGGYFLRVDGLRGGERGGTKTRHLAGHLDRLAPRPSRAVLIGDTVDDAVAARDAGVDCILLDGGAGLHTSGELATAGVPVVATLAQAMALVVDERPFTTV
ncbi:MAG: HAD hydrolase-like protein [Candidatus Dormibacteria bacterium]|jgi:phosphoglycolate phosphatase-like HAD superfamily hydrolase